VPDLAESLIGTWRLLSRIDRGRDGTVRPDPVLGSDPLGLVTYTRDRFSAQFMKRDRSDVSSQAPAGSGRNNTSAVGGYDAYFGTWRAGADGTVVHRLEAALTPANVGLEVARKLVVEGDRLTITLETASLGGEAVTRTLVFERVG
jgi:hypothetical protein